MKQTYTNSSNKDLIQISLIAALLVMLALAFEAKAQEGTQGNTTIFEGGQMTFFGSHNFVTGGSGTQPGIIKTIRTGTFGILNYAPGADHTGSSDAGHVDGYVGKYGTTAFTFPIGNGTKLRPASISAPTSGAFQAAYWFANPNVATLPAGGPFPTAAANLGTGVTGVSNVEYWDVNGPSAISLTLTWDAASNLNTLAGGNLSNLGIVGYNTTTSKWESLGGTATGTLTATGSVVATGVTPDNYAAFTFGNVQAALTPDLRPFIIMADRNYIDGAMSKNLTVRVRNIRENSVASSLITVYVYKPTIQSTFVLTGTAAADWTITPSPSTTYYILTSNVDMPYSTTGYNITGTLTMPASTAKGVYNLRATIPDLSGGEVIQDNVNNSITAEITRN